MREWGADVFAHYLQFTKDTEPPVIHHRWSYLTSLGAVIGRRAYLAHGHFRVFPTLYTMLIGEPAVRKSTSVKMVKKLLAASGYDCFAADKTTKEKFLLDLEGLLEDTDEMNIGGKKSEKYDTVTAENLWGGTAEGEPREVFISADEFNDFAGANNLDFYTTLGSLWDFDSPIQPFTQRLKNSKSISIYQPTISILAGNTPELFARAFPPEAIGSGFLSRLLLIHGERTSRKITFPPPPDPELGNLLTTYLQRLRNFEPGELKLSSLAYKMLDAIYQGEDSGHIHDTRFKGYFNRRFTQLMRICVIIATAKFQDELKEEDVLQANTVLSHAEILMPKALGEFGKNRNSDVANRVMDILEKSIRPVTIPELWKHMRRDLGKEAELVQLVHGLVTADRIQHVKGTGGFLPKKYERKDPRFVDWSYLTQEERDMI